MPHDPSSVPAGIEIAHLTSLLMQAPAFICSLREPNHVIELANENIFELLGRRDIVGKPLFEAIPELASQGFRKILDQVYQSGESFSASEMPAFLRRADGTLEKLFVNQVYQAVRDADGNISGIFIHGVDVTEQVRAREATLENEKQLRLMADTMPQIVWMTRPDGFHEYYNRRWYEFIGATREESEGEGWGDPLHPDDEPRARARWKRSLESGEPYEIEYRFRRFDGEYRWFLARALPVRDENGAIIKWFGTCTDIEERRQTEQALENANRLKDEFLATLSHELRTPLNAILGWASLLTTNELDADMTRQALETIERSARAQARLIEDLLDVSRILTGKMHLQMQPLELSACVQNALETVRPAALAKEISIRAEFEPGVHLVAGDGERIAQITWNLLSNAIKFTPKRGNITVRVFRRDSQTCLSVADTGRGIDPDFLPFVFDRFRQADASVTRREGGLGIGLGLVRHLMELHGGGVSVVSAGLNQGSTFTVSFPVPAVVMNQQDGFAPEKSHFEATKTTTIVTTGTTTELLTGLKILLVDDEEDVRTLLGFVLQEKGARIEFATSASHAMQKIATCSPDAPFDLLMSDIGMPGESGYELIHRVRRHESQIPNAKGSFLPAIAVTAYARNEDRDQALQAGFQAHLIKPVVPNELITLVASLTGRTTQDEAPDLLSEAPKS